MYVAQKCNQAWLLSPWLILMKNRRHLGAVPPLLTPEKRSTKDKLKWVTGRWAHSNKKTVINFHNYFAPAAFLINNGRF